MCVMYKLSSSYKAKNKNYKNQADYYLLCFALLNQLIDEN